MILGAVGLLRKTAHCQREAENHQRHERPYLPLGRRIPRVVAAIQAAAAKGGREPGAGDFFGVHGGMVVLLVDDSNTPRAQQQRPPRTQQGLAASEHLAAHRQKVGIVTVYTGKVEVGQNSRARPAAAEEARRIHPHGDGPTPPSPPCDMGPLGSMHAAHGTRGPKPQPRRAMLGMHLAAQKWNVDRDTLSVADGRVVNGSRSPVRRTGPTARNSPAPSPRRGPLHQPPTGSVRNLRAQGQRPRNHSRRAQVRLRYPTPRQYGKVLSILSPTEQRWHRSMVPAREKLPCEGGARRRLRRSHRAQCADRFRWPPWRPPPVPAPGFPDGIRQSPGRSAS